MPVVLISRGTMSGVTLLVEQLRERTGARCVSREDLVALVNQHGALAQRIVEQLSDAARAYEAFCELRRPYLILMRAALLEYARRDNLVYHGFSGHLLLPPIPHFMAIRLNAPREVRTTMTMQRLHCDEEAANSYIDRDDEQRVPWAPKRRWRRSSPTLRGDGPRGRRAWSSSRRRRTRTPSSRPTWRRSGPR